MTNNPSQIEERVKTIVQEQLFDRIGQNSIPFYAEVKKRLAARPRSAVEELVKVLDERIHALGIPDTQKASILSEVFMKTAGKDFLAEGFLTEEELTAAPSVTWRDRDKSRGLTIIEHIQDQFAGRINRGFRRSDLRIADPSSEKALRNWLAHPAHELPDDWLRTFGPQAEISELHRDAMTLRARRRQSKDRNSAKI